jgi:hypothetical protein
MNIWSAEIAQDWPLVTSKALEQQASLQILTLPFIRSVTLDNILKCSKIQKQREKIIASTLAS